MHFERRNQKYNFMHFERQNAFQNAAYKIFFSRKKPHLLFSDLLSKTHIFFIWPYLLYFIVRLASLHPH